MPIYRYRCTVCQHEFEEIMGHKDPNPACPAMLNEASRYDENCFGDTVRIPSIPGPPQGGPTPRFYR